MLGMRKTTLRKLGELNKTYVAPERTKHVVEPTANLPDVSSHEASALLDLFRNVLTPERARLIAEARRDVKLASVLLNAHPRLTKLGDDTRAMLREAHCATSQLEKRDAQLERRIKAARAAKEIGDIAQAITGE